MVESSEISFESGEALWQPLSKRAARPSLSTKNNCPCPWRRFLRWMGWLLFSMTHKPLNPVLEMNPILELNPSMELNLRWEFNPSLELILSLELNRKVDKFYNLMTWRFPITTLDRYIIGYIYNLQWCEVLKITISNIFCNVVFIILLIL